jgi:hypothetical protein
MTRRVERGSALVGLDRGIDIVVSIAGCGRSSLSESLRVSDKISILSCSGCILMMVSKLGRLLAQWAVMLGNSESLH